MMVSSTWAVLMILPEIEAYLSIVVGLAALSSYDSGECHSSFSDAL